MEEQQKDDGEALFLQNRRPQSNQRFNNFRQTPNARHTHAHRRYTDSGGSSNLRSSNFTYSGGQHALRYASQHQQVGTHPTATQGRYQPRFKSRGPDKPRTDCCNFCGLNGHFERECDLRSILDRMKDYENKLLERRNRTLSGQVHHLEEPDPFKQDQDPDSFETADQVIDACLVELNLVETPQQLVLGT